jgi:hypothetical protein
MSVALNTTIKLDAHSPKKDAVITVGLPTIAANDVVIWCQVAVDPADNNAQLVATWQKLLAYFLSHTSEIIIPAANIIVWMPPGGGDPDIVAENLIGTTATTDTIGLIVASGLGDAGRSHFIDRTTKRLLERWLEETKDQQQLI